MASKGTLSVVIPASVVMAADQFTMISTPLHHGRWGGVVMRELTSYQCGPVQILELTPYVG